MTKKAELIDIVSSIYDTVLNPDAWMIVGEKIRQRYHCTYSGLYVYDTRNSALVHDATAGTDDSFVNAYTSRFCFMDPYRATEELAAKNSHVPLTNPIFDEFFKIEHKHQKYPYFAEYWHKHDSYHTIGAMVDLPGHLRAGICAPRNTTIGAYTKKEKEDFEYIRQAFHKAMKISKHVQQLGKNVVALEQTTNFINQPVFIVDQFGKIMSTNHAAEQHLARNGVLKNVGGKLFITDLTLRKQLNSTIYRACNEELGSNTSLSKLFKNGPIELLVSPMQRYEDLYPINIKRAAVFLFENYLSQPEVLAKVYKLSHVEGIVLGLVINGANVADIVKIRNTSKETIKTQLRSIYRKTNTKNMNEIRRLVRSNRY